MAQIHCRSAEFTNRTENSPSPLKNARGKAQGRILGGIFTYYFYKATKSHSCLLFWVCLGFFSTCIYIVPLSVHIRAPQRLGLPGLMAPMNLPTPCPGLSPVTELGCLEDLRAGDAFRAIAAHCQKLPYNKLTSGSMEQFRN